MTPRVIRAASPQDFEVGRRLLDEYRRFVQQLIPQIAETVQMDFDREFAIFPRQYQKSSGELLLGGDPPNGCVALRYVDDRRCELERLYVRPSAREHGLGEALTRACIEAARDSGRTQLILVTSPPYEAAIRLYRRLGFRDIRVEDDPAVARYGTSHAIVLGMDL